VAHRPGDFLWQWFEERLREPPLEVRRDAGVALQVSAVLEPFDTSVTAA
jgi:hypothetical protein